MTRKGNATASKKKPRKSSHHQAHTVPATKHGPQSAVYWSIVVIIFCSTLWLFWPATKFPFINFDDNLYVTDNANIRRGLQWDTIRWAFVSLEASNWHPLTWLSHALDASIWGVSQSAPAPNSELSSEVAKWSSSASGHHLTSILLHSLNAVLAMVTFSKLTGTVWRSALLALLFAWHPLRVESVAWIAERKDLLSGLFSFLTILSYSRYVRQPNSRLNYWLTIGLFAAGLMSKPMAITVPFVLLLLDFWPLGRLKWDRLLPARKDLVILVVEKLPMFVLVIGSAVITYLAQLQGGSIVTDQLPLAERLSNAAISYIVYLWQTVVPFDLVVFYPYSKEQLHWARTLPALAALAIISLAVIRWRNRWQFLPAGWFWYLGTLVPVIGIVQVGGQAHADRYTYFPLIGISIAVIWLGNCIAERWAVTRWPMWIAAVCFLLFSAAVTRQQLDHWRSSSDLFIRATQVSPHSALAWSNLGAAYMSEGKFTESVAAYRRAVQLTSELDTKAGLATALSADQQVEAAIQIFKELIADNPKDYRLANNLAWILATESNLELRDPQEAIRLAESADRNSGGTNPSVLDTLAAAYAADRRYDDALKAIDRAIAAAKTLNDETVAQQLQIRRQEIQRQSSEPDQPVNTSTPSL